MLLVIKLNYDIKKAKETKHSLKNTLKVLFDFVFAYADSKMIKRKTKVILLSKLLKHVRLVFSQARLKKEFIEFLSTQNMNAYMKFFKVSSLFKLSGALTEENFVMLNLAIYLHLIESKFNVQNKKDKENKASPSTGSKSMIKEKIGDYGLLNLNDHYMNYQSYYDTVSQANFTSLVTQLMKDYEHILNANILHKMADSLGDSFFRFSYALCLYTSCKFFICDRVISKKESGDGLNQQ